MGAKVKVRKGGTRPKISEGPPFSHAGLGPPVSVPTQSGDLQWTQVEMGTLVLVLEPKPLFREGLGSETCWIQKGDHIWEVEVEELLRV